MAFDDFGAAIGPAVQAGFGAYQWMEGQERQQEQDEWAKQKHALDQQFKREDLAQEKEIANLKMAHAMVLQGIKAQTAIELLNLGNLSKEKIAELFATEQRHRTDTQADTAFRGQDLNFNLGVIRDTTTQRGQDITSTTARRGQDITSSTARRGQDFTFNLGTRGQDIGATTADENRDAANWRAQIENERRLRNDEFDYLRPGGATGRPSPFRTPSVQLGAGGGAAAAPVGPSIPPRPQMPPPPSGAAGTSTGPPPVPSVPQGAGTGTISIPGVPPPSAPPPSGGPRPAPNKPPASRGSASAPAARGAPPPVVSPVEAAGRQIQILVGQSKAAEARGDHAEVERIRKEVMRLRASVGR